MIQTKKELEIREFVINSEPTLRVLGFSHAGSLTDFCSPQMRSGRLTCTSRSGECSENLALKQQLYRLIEPALDTKSICSVVDVGVNT